MTFNTILRHVRRAAFLACLLGATGAVQAHGNAWPNVIIRTPSLGFSYGVPTVPRYGYGYRYAPRWNYAPPRHGWRGHGHGYLGDGYRNKRHRGHDHDRRHDRRRR